MPHDVPQDVKAQGPTAGPGTGDLRPARAERSDLLRGRLGEVVEEITAVPDRHSVRQSTADGLGVGLRAVAAHDLNPGCARSQDSSASAPWPGSTSTRRRVSASIRIVAYRCRRRRAKSSTRSTRGCRRSRNWTTRRSSSPAAGLCEADRLARHPRHAHDERGVEKPQRGRHGLCFGPVADFPQPLAQIPLWRVQRHGP